MRVIQRIAHWIGGVALHWFYCEVEVSDADRIPVHGPILIAMNHQNALIDALLALWIVPRELRITAKATLWDTFLGAVLMKAAGIIPLRRATDDPASTAPIRNRHAFEEMIDELRRGGAILVFPEGRSHNDPEIAPLRTGLARAALRARTHGIHGIQIIAIGVTFANKAEPNTRVSAHVADSINLDTWEGSDPRELTEAVAERLRKATSGEDAAGLLRRTATRRGPAIRLAAWWGRVMHEIPLRLARREAIRRSKDAGEPAMYTMTFGLAAILVSYLIEVSVVLLVSDWVIALLFLASLITGAYWAAYADHPPDRS